MANKGIIVYSRDKFRNKDINKTEPEKTEDILGKMIKTAREERNLTAEQLGKLVDIPTDQIIKLEQTAKSVPIEVISKVFNALQAEISFSIKLKAENLK